MRSALPCWALSWIAPSANSSIPPGKTPKKKTVKPLVHWTPNSMPVWVKRWTPLGAQLGCPQLSSAAEGTAPCPGSALGHGGNLGGPRIDVSVFPCSLCGLQQRQMESTRAYYNRMAQITVILRERHGNRYRPGELVRMSKDCFYAGLLPENCPMVVHLKDQPHTTPLDFLKALLEQEENDALTRTRYPLSTSSRTSQPSKPAERYHRHLPAEKRNAGYTVHPAQLDADPTEAVPEADPMPLTDTLDALETWYNDGFLIGLRQAAEVSELRHGHCYICQKEGHHWRQCKEPLSPELQELSDQQDREHEDRKKRALNPRGGVGMKGGHAPIPLAGVSPAPPQVPSVPAQ